MRHQIFILIALLATTVAFAQKKELRQAGSAISKSAFAEAKQLLSSLEPTIASADERQQAEFYLYKGQAYMGAAGDSEADMNTAAESFNKVIEIESSDKKRHTDKAEEGKVQLLENIVNSAIQDQNKQDYEASSKKLYTAYTLSKNDTVYLYYAAGSAVNANDYDAALSHYEKLIQMGYDGRQMQHTAVNKNTGEVEAFGSADERDLMLKTGEYIRPQDKMSDSKRPEILRNAALIYIEQDRTDEALRMIDNALKANPGDADLMVSKANIMLQTDDMAGYRKVMEEVVASDPTNPELYYNLGVSSAELGEAEEAEKYYKKALQLDPEYTESKINLAVLILDGEKSIVEEMNSLGTSAADNRRYEALKNERNTLYQKALPYLEDAFAARQTPDLGTTLANIYDILGEDAKADAVRKKVRE